MSRKRDFYQVHNIHPATPKRLVSEFHKAGWNERELARRRGVNILYVSQLIRHGIEPTDRTVKGQETRAKLYLPRLKPKPRKERKPRTQKQEAIIAMSNMVRQGLRLWKQGKLFIQRR